MDDAGSKPPRPAGSLPSDATTIVPLRDHRTGPTMLAAHHPSRRPTRLHPQPCRVEHRDLRTVGVVAQLEPEAVVREVAPAEDAPIARRRERMRPAGRGVRHAAQALDASRDQHLDRVFRVAPPRVCPPAVDAPIQPQPEPARTRRAPRIQLVLVGDGDAMQRAARDRTEAHARSPCTHAILAIPSLPPPPLPPLPSPPLPPPPATPPPSSSATGSA
eukprot:7382214-Prymnesium_polylepis.1